MARTIEGDNDGKDDTTCACTAQDDTTRTRAAHKARDRFLSRFRTDFSAAGAVARTSVVVGYTVLVAV